MACSNFSENLKALSLQKQSEGCYFSKSYTTRMMVICVSRNAKVGVDIEEKRSRSPETMKYFWGKFKTFEILNVPTNDDVHSFYTAWTAMESCFKLIGTSFFASENTVVNFSSKIVLHDGIEHAWFEHFNINNMIICLSSDKKFTKKDVTINHYGKEDNK